MTGDLCNRAIAPATFRPEPGCAGAAVTADGETVAPANLPVNVGQRRKSLAGDVRSMWNGDGPPSFKGRQAAAACTAWKTRARRKIADASLRAVFKERWNVHPASGRHGRGWARSRPVPAERRRYPSRPSHTSPAGKGKGANALRPCGGLYKEIVMPTDKKNQPNMDAQNKEQPMKAQQQQQRQEPARQARQQQEPGKGEKRDMAGERNERGRPDDEMQKQQEEQRKLEERAKKPKDGMENRDGRGH